MVIISNEQISVTVASLGGELLSINDKETGMEYIWQGEEKYWGRHSLNIFPIVGRLYKKKYKLNGETYPIGIHGFLPNAQMKVVYQKTNKCCFLLRENEETMKIFPYKFEFYIKYKLNNRTLNIEFKVHNYSENTMYCGMGGHPGFNVPLEQGLVFEDYNISFSTPCKPNQVELNSAVLCTGVKSPYQLKDDKYLPLRHSLFMEDAIVLTDIPRSVSISSPKGHRKITLDFPQMPYIGFWHKPNTDAPFVCIEPWSCLPGRDKIVEELEKKQDLTAILGGESFTNKWSITVE